MLNANPETSPWTHMPCLADNAPDRVTDSHREACQPRSPPHKANTVALEEQLEGTRITKKGDSCFLQPHLKWWLQKDNVLFSPYRCIKRRRGAHLGEHIAR